jgi:hypothetical protein
MAEMDVDAGRIDAVLDAQRCAGLEAALELLLELGFRHDLLGTAFDQGKLIFDGFHDPTSHDAAWRGSAHRG